MVRCLHPKDPGELIQELETEMRLALAGPEQKTEAIEDSPELVRAKLRAMRFGQVAADGPVHG